MRINLVTPFAEKDTVKALGASWDLAKSFGTSRILLTSRAAIHVRLIAVSFRGIEQLFFCKFRELVLSCCAYASNQGLMVR